MGLRSMFSGVSGLQSHSTWLDVIGNNISNTNTVAYKASRVEFADQISQTLYGGTGNNSASNIGGVNPQQVGLGTRVASIQTLFTQGTIQNTGNSTDIALVGNGFLMAKVGSQTLLTRQGNLTFDSNGYLVDQGGGLIQGFQASIRYVRHPLDSRIVVGGGNFPPGVAPGNITEAQLFLDNTNPSAASNIRIPRDFVLPPKATTVMHMSGNLDSFQQATNPGGLTNLGAAGFETLPIGLAAVTVNGPKLQKAVIGGQNVLQQTGDQAQPPDPTNPFWANQAQPTVTGGINLLGARAAGLATYAWNQQPPVPPARVLGQTVYDSTGNPRSVSILFYQVNDLGTAVPAINVPPMSQAIYAWYAFDTTNGAAINNNSLIGGTGIIEGDQGAVAPPGYDRGAAGDTFIGDFIYFNTDGSLASQGGTHIQGGIFHMDKADIYLPPIQPAAAVGAGPAPPMSPIPNLGAEITRITLDFGTAGMLGFGRRDGVVGDAEGSYQVVNGVNTYVPNSTVFCKTQDGYTDGILTGVQFDRLGNIIGNFTNGQNATLAQVVMAMPENQGGLSKVGGNYYSTSPNSGGMFVGLAGQDGMGVIQGNSLELSNVDLTIELSNMIIAQRGFEVNARVISVTNSTLQTTVQLGQGG